MIRQAPITHSPVQEAERVGFLQKHAGSEFARFEMLVFAALDQASSDYEGGVWDFFELSNGGFFMAPSTDDRFSVSWALNGFEGVMSAEAAGIGVCLFVMSGLSFQSAEAELMAEKYYALRDFALDHPEAATILAFIE